MVLTRIYLILLLCDPEENVLRPGLMLRTRRTFFAVLVTVGFIVTSGSPSASANTILTYMSPNFSTFNDSTLLPNVYTTDDHVAMTLELSSPLGPNLYNKEIVDQVVRWAVTDGVNAWSSTTCPAVPAFPGCNFYARFSTDENAAISEWRVWMDMRNTWGAETVWTEQYLTWSIGPPLAQRNFAHIGLPAYSPACNPPYTDNYGVRWGPDCTDSARTSAFGTWSTADSFTEYSPGPGRLFPDPVPEPSSLDFLVIGLAGLVVLRFSCK